VISGGSSMRVWAGRTRESRLGSPSTAPRILINS
jgi:hypothetical protein